MKPVVSQQQGHRSLLQRQRERERQIREKRRQEREAGTSSRAAPSPSQRLSKKAGSMTRPTEQNNGANIKNVNRRSYGYQNMPDRQDKGRGEKPSQQSQQRGAQRLSDKRRDKLLKVLAREENKPYVCKHDPNRAYVLVDGEFLELDQETWETFGLKKTNRVKSKSRNRSMEEKYNNEYECKYNSEEEEGDGDFYVESAQKYSNGARLNLGSLARGEEIKLTNLPCTLIEETVFFNGCNHVVSDLEKLSSSTSQRDAAVAIELWVLPVFDQDADRHLRTSRHDLGFRNSLLATAKDRSPWRYILRKSLSTNLKNVLGNRLQHQDSLRSVHPLVGERLNCTPTIMLNQASGQLRVDLSLCTWKEEKSMDLLNWQIEVASESFTSNAHLKHGQWSHLALLVTSSDALLFVNGRMDAAFSGRGEQRIAMNRFPMFIGSCPRMDSNGTLIGTDGIVGFVSQAKWHSNVTDLSFFANDEILANMPPQPRPPNEWKDVMSNRNGASQSSSSGIGVSQAEQQRRIRERQEMQRSWLDQQMKEKEALRAKEHSERLRFAQDVAQRAKEYAKEQLAYRVEQQQHSLRVSKELKDNLMFVQERKRLEMLDERISDQARFGGLQDKYRKDTSRRHISNDDYARELKAEALKRELARKQQNEHQTYIERVRVEAERKKYLLEQALKKQQELERKEAFRRELQTQIDEKRSSTLYSVAGNDKFMTAEERALNTRVLRMVASTRISQNF
mmetsp:Transcript_21418/g.42020  ORF Transcript_21418/g.42020 Transcript_21418/m.42020 type:complete len:735 (-) Transcript_21418:77-2281(-)|eukprot:CAMPEP_0171540878 /NCGR_PEP_ID=MMETSP0960-20121227/1450_1 /TAXON_ID=87120 /ORGANISM="Aurantiochytrium limacinum, Strain ATCCMYA-1381" /LENGTH=734 /DNA_ID=CAMNT_0012088145 /DNA_START=134 /DNA_END=2338 /DNA_ORIENTATION=+